MVTRPLNRLLLDNVNMFKFGVDWGAPFFITNFKFVLKIEVAL